VYVTAKQTADDSRCSYKGGYFYIKNFSLALFLSSVQAAERILSTLLNNSLTNSFDKILMMLPQLPAASPHFRPGGSNGGTKILGVSSWSP